MLNTLNATPSLPDLFSIIQDHQEITYKLIGSEMDSYTSKNVRYTQCNTLPFPIDSVSYKTIKKSHISSLALKWIHTPQRMLHTLNATPYPSRLIPYHLRPSRNHI